MLLNHLTRGAVALLATLAVAAPAAAQEMRAPTGDIEITIGAGPGSGPDLVQRRVAEILNSEGIVENPIVVNNRTGGGWTVASNYVIGQAGNENLLMGLSPTVIATPIVQGLKNFYSQFTPLAVLVKQDHLIVVRADSEINTLTDFMNEAKEEEYAVSMAGANIGSTDSIILTLLEQAGNVKLNYIPYDGGGGQIISALLGGAVTAIAIPPDEIISLIRSGEVKPIALLAEDRNPAPELAEIPTAREQGVDVVWDSTQSLVLPPNTDPALVAWWDDKIGKMVQSQRWKELVAQNYYRDAYQPAAETGAALQQLYDRYLPVMQRLGLAKEQPQ